MIDTIAISQSYIKFPTFARLREIGWDLHQDVLTRERRKWVFNTNTDTEPRLSIHFAPDNSAHLRAEISLPKMIFGENVSLPNQSEVWRGLSKLSEYVTARSDLEFDALNAKVRRVDYATNLRLDESAVVPTLAAIALRTLPRFNRLTFNDTTVYFNSKGKRKPRIIRFYSKFDEVVDNRNKTPQTLEKAKGLIRFECSYTKRDAVKYLSKQLNLPDVKASTMLTFENSENVINRFMTDLNIKSLFAPPQEYLLILLDKYGINRAMRLVGFLKYCETYGKNFYKNVDFGFSKTAYYRAQKDCRESGVFSL